MAQLRQANITGVVVNHAVFGATMKPTSLAVIYEGATVGNVAFPQVELVGGGTTAISILSDMTISDTTAFTAFAVAALQRPSVSLTMSGSIDVHAVGVTFDGLDFEKVVTLQGWSRARVCCDVVRGSTGWVRQGCLTSRHLLRLS